MADESRLREEDVLSVNTSSDPAGSASQLVCPAMYSMLFMLTLKGGASAHMCRCLEGRLRAKTKNKKPLALESQHAEAATLKSSPTRIECARLPLV